MRPPLRPFPPPPKHDRVPAMLSLVALALVLALALSRVLGMWGTA